MQFIIENMDKLSDVIQYISHLPKDKRFVVKVDEFKNNKTAGQRNYWHKCLGIIAKECGYRKADLKYEIKKAVLGLEQYTNKKTGEVVHREVSSEELSTKKYSQLIEETLIIAHKLDLIMPDPRDYYR